MVGVIFTTSSIMRLLLQSTVVIMSKIPNTPKECKESKWVGTTHIREQFDKSLYQRSRPYFRFSVGFQPFSWSWSLMMISIIICLYCVPLYVYVLSALTGISIHVCFVTLDNICLFSSVIFCFVTGLYLLIFSVNVPSSILFYFWCLTVLYTTTGWTK